MIQFFALLLIAAGAITGLTYAINFFWAIGLKKSFSWAFFFIFVISVFLLSGVWENHTSYAIGSLTPIFLLVLLACWLGVKYGKKIIIHLINFIKK